MPAPPPGPSAYAEPVGAKYLPLDALGFYDRDKAGQARTVRNDLGGSLPAMVQFAQSHTVDPSGNATREMPMLTMEREALLLVTPDPSLGEIDSLQVRVSVNGLSKGTLPMRHPNEIYRSDYAASDGRPDYVYSRRAWSVVLPWDWVQPGLELRVSDNRSRSGTLGAAGIEFASAAELVVHSVRLGMLTAPERNDANQWFLSQPASAATDYFQTIPAARLTAAYYEDVTLPRVMVASGAIYDSASATSGDVYSGDMRENTAKSTFSVGINLANYGVTSSGMQSQQQPQVFQSVVVHHARGLYTNGVVTHGLSGGNSILTLISSQGNEFSHEIGHHFGLGHYPGQAGDNYFWAAHHHDSGWGYMGHRKRMRGNVLWNRAATGGLGGVPVLDNTYRFAPDAMAGGDFTSALSRYTHYTGYSTRRAIQPSLDKPVPSATSATGYRKWNPATRTMAEFAPPVPSQSAVWFNSANGRFLAPRLHGVPVVTLLGGYDPVTGKALVYAPLRSNWGNVYALPDKAVDTTEPRQCWLRVDFAARASQRIALAGRRMQADLVNKLHVNLAQSEQPTRATLSCQTPGLAAEDLYTVDIPTSQPAMDPPVVVGKEAGYTALRRSELPSLESALLGLAGKKVLSLSAASQVLLDSHSADAQELSAPARAQLQRYLEQQQQAMRLNRWMNAYGPALKAGTPAAQTAFLEFLATLGLQQQPLVPVAQPMTMPNGNCVQKAGNEVQVAAKSLCSGGAGEQWILDGRGSIRSRADLSLCLADQGGTNAVRLTPCDTRADNQVWDTSVARRIARGGRCLDLSGGSLTNNVGVLITYPCTGGSNQQWSGLVASDSLALTLASSANAPLLDGLPAQAVARQR